MLPYYRKNGFELHIDTLEEYDNVKKIFTILDTATGVSYDWNRSPYGMPTPQEFANEVSDLLQTIAE